MTVTAIPAIHALVTSIFEHGTRPRNLVINWRILHRKPDTTISVHLIELTTYIFMTTTTIILQCRSRVYFKQPV